MNNESGSIRYASALAAIKLTAENGQLDMTPEQFDFLTSDRPWINTERSEARRCLEAAIYGSVDFLSLPRFAVPAEFIAGTIAVFVHPSNFMTAVAFMDQCEWSENVINGIERPVKANELMAHLVQIVGGNQSFVDEKLKLVRSKVAAGKDF